MAKLAVTIKRILFAFCHCAEGKLLFSGVSVANFTHDCAVQIGIANVVGVDGKIKKK